MVTILVAIVIVVMVALGVFVLLAWAATEAATERPAPLYERRRPGMWAVELIEVGRKRMKVLQVVREATGLGMIQSKAMLDQAPVILVRDIAHDDADELASRLEVLGAEAVALPMAELAPLSTEPDLR